MAARILLVLIVIIGIVAFREKKIKAKKTALTKKTRSLGKKITAPPIVKANIPVNKSESVTTSTTAVQANFSVPSIPENSSQQSSPSEKIIQAEESFLVKETTQMDMGPIKIPQHRIILRPLPTNEILSPEDKVENLKETLSYIHKDLKEIYKDKKLVGKYSEDPTKELIEDAIEYLLNPEAFEKNASPDLIKNTKEFLSTVEQTRKKYETTDN